MRGSSWHAESSRTAGRLLCRLLLCLPLLAGGVCGFAAPAFGTDNPADLSSNDPDTTAPSLSSAEGSNTTLTLTYDEALAAGSVPAGTAFTVKVNGTAVNLATSNPVAVSGSTVTLTLAGAVGIGKTVTVSYAAPTANPVQDSAGNAAAGFTDQSVTVGGICDRTPAVRTAILDAISGVSGCEDVTSSHLNSITGTLDLSSNELSTLQENDFDGLDSLTHLYLNKNKLSSLDKDIFDDLDSLTSLNFYNNKLSSLDKDIFDGLDSLTSLNFYNNELSSLDKDIFDGLDSLTYINLSNNMLTCLPEDLYKKSVISEEKIRNLPNCVVSVTSITRRSMHSGGKTNADTLVWRVVFSEAVSNVDRTDFTVGGTGIGSPTVAVAAVSDTGDTTWDVT
ncbi:MAG: leucine-rich repeat protein [Synechococcus sp. SB0662_bin_45]|nr:leucine-rich repeat protein [Synechococcus sp. SB0662_bin_45]